MTTRARVDRLARRIAAHAPTAAAGVCRCPVDRPALVWIDLGDDDPLADQLDDPCQRCGGIRPIVILDLGADAGEIIAARDAGGGLREIARVGMPTDDL